MVIGFSGAMFFVMYSDLGDLQGGVAPLFQRVEVDVIGDPLAAVDAHRCSG
jgi:hypothetical protein